MSLRDAIEAALDATRDQSRTAQAAYVEARLRTELAAHPESIATAMQNAWNDFTIDTGCFPDCFEWRDGKLYADFDRGNFARMVAGWLFADETEGR